MLFQCIVVDSERSKDLTLAKTLLIVIAVAVNLQSRCDWNIQ